MTKFPEIAELPFEKALAQLEEIVSKGQALKEHCEKQLKEAEARIEKITLKPEGKPSGTAPLDVE